MVIAILALQGAFAEHGKVLDKLCVEHFEIRKKKDLEREFDALILPGGESTVMGKLLQELELMERLRERIQSGMPVFGTCAGMILLAKEISLLQNRESSWLQHFIRSWMKIPGCMSIFLR